MHSHVSIEYANPNNLNDSIVLDYRLRDNPIVAKWINKLQQAQAQQIPIDDPTRFYGFGSKEQQIAHALSEINKQVDIINSYKNIVDRRLTDLEDQDTLNYLHHIFEVYHGLLNNPSEFFIAAPPQVQKALGELNIAVHRCESISRGSRPRHVVTYFGLVKEEILDHSDYEYFTDVSQFGTMYLNYVEIGKTLTDLALDNDQYISDEAFKPFTYYSADFTVRFFHPKLDMLALIKAHVSKYYSQNKQFFLARGLEENHPLLKPGLPPIADLDNAPNNVLELLASRQFVKSVNLT
jgi:hypothetical protein